MGHVPGIDKIYLGNFLMMMFLEVSSGPDVVLMLVPAVVTVSSVLVTGSLLVDAVSGSCLWNCSNSWRRVCLGWLGADRLGGLIH